MQQGPPLNYVELKPYHLALPQARHLTLSCPHHPSGPCPVRLEPGTGRRKNPPLDRFQQHHVPHSARRLIDHLLATLTTHQTTHNDDDDEQQQHIGPTRTRRKKREIPAPDCAQKLILNEPNASSIRKFRTLVTAQPPTCRKISSSADASSTSLSLTLSRFGSSLVFLSTYLARREPPLCNPRSDSVNHLFYIEAAHAFVLPSHSLSRCSR